MSFSTNGLDQRVADLALRPNTPNNPESFSVTGRTVRQLSEITGRVCNIVFIGQSTNNNMVQGFYTPTNPTKLFNLSIAHPSRSQIFQAKEPLLTSDCQNGHHGMAYGDGLVSGGHADNVILTNISLGGSFVADWVPGGASGRPGSLAYRIGLAARVIRYCGLWDVPTIIDWQQGEWDSDNPGTPHATYKASLEKVIAEFRNVGLLRTGNVMLVHKCTRLTNSQDNRDAIRSAQADVVDDILVKAGADIDTLSLNTTRYDDAHFTVSGAIQQANLKIPFAAQYLSLL